MHTSFVRPEDRQRSGRGACDFGERTDGPPDGLRSEAFAEDLVIAAAPAAPSRAAVARVAAPRRLRRARGWRQAVGLLIAAAFGPRRASAVD